MAMSSSLLCACLNSFTYSSFDVKGTKTLTKTSWGFMSTLRYPRKKSLALICNARSDSGIVALNPNQENIFGKLIFDFKQYYQQNLVNVLTYGYQEGRKMHNMDLSIRFRVKEELRLWDKSVKCPDPLHRCLQHLWSHARAGTGILNPYGARLTNCVLHWIVHLSYAPTLNNLGIAAWELGRQNLKSLTALSGVSFPAT